ncbi:molecular chaperone DnaJ [Wolbachia endosymbiont (group B) of Ischnura elegans]|uniref:molecular chaperone DnaJ n=1 Tax=Wolbachia endosymbiont (group B) of Ischnura elegans TaxID=2954021 RepID=UPI002232C72E|nr:molecular chaperone DnaJ [Wolbachia endosymbiont (group B) of Ischnura elegans]
MNQHFKLTNQEFNNNTELFDLLELKAVQVVGKNYQELSRILKRQYNKLVLVNHPDKGGDKNRFNQIYNAYQGLKKYIEPLESGNPCIKVSVNAESNGRLTEREFCYRQKLFVKLGIGKEAIGEDFEKLNSMLEKKLSEDVLLRDYITQLYSYILPLNKKENLIKEDKKALALKFIERKNALLTLRNFACVPLALLITITIACYFSCAIILLNFFINKVTLFLLNHYMKKYENSEISTDEFINKVSYIMLGSKLLVTYPLAAFSVYLIATNFIANGITIGGVILGPMLLLATFIEILAPVFLKACEIYTEKHTKDLLEEDPRDRVEKETDLLKWYDPRKLLMPIIMPLVRKCFAEVTNELAERNFDEISTDLSSARTEQLPKKPQTIEFAEQSIKV